MWQRYTSRTAAKIRSRSSPPASTARFSSASRTRVDNSAAAFSVNVITTSSSTVALPAASMLVTRSTSTVVLPVPAPASTARSAPRSVVICRRAAWSRSSLLIRRS